LVNNQEQDLTSDHQQENILNILINVAPIFQKALSFDSMIGITDTEKVIGNFPGTKVKIDGDIIGMPLPRRCNL